jgi:heme A synthase
VLLGFANLFSGIFYPELGGHIVMMVFAATVAHIVHAVMKRRPDEEKTFAPHVVGTLVVLAMVVAGIMAIGRPIVG